jgi:release factor glutamine methyltransferase
VKTAGAQLTTMDIRRALGDAIAHLESARVPSARLAAELLLMHVLACDRAWLYAHPEKEIGAEAKERFLALVTRRAEGFPTQYLTGRQEFWGLEFEVTPEVLIPRPETEHVVEVALDRLRARLSATPDELKDVVLHIADVGTGSGCLAVALASELPNARVFATDLSAAALAVARRNAARNCVAARIEFAQSNLLEAFSPEYESTQVENSASRDADHGPRTTASFDLIVSNPPYVAIADAASLPREVREHEPPAALFAGESGLDFYAPLVRAAEMALAPGGALVVELGYNAAGHVRSLLERANWRDIAITNDLAGVARVASALRGESQPDCAARDRATGGKG